MPHTAEPASSAGSASSAGRSSHVLLRDIALVVVGPVLLAVAGLMHPSGLNSSTAAAWAHQHVLLVPVWPLLALGLVVPLWGRPRRDLAGFATAVAWVCAFGYAVFYTGLDAIAGIAAGTAYQHAGPHPRSVVNPVFHIGDQLGHTGVYCLGVGVLAASLALFVRHGVRVLPGAALLLVCCWSFFSSHIFHPRGVWTMIGFALGFALLVWAAATGRRGSRGPGAGAGADVPPTAP